jgi:hypothetical protein
MNSDELKNIDRAIGKLTKATRIVCYVGAGASASSGLCTFRGLNAAGNLAQVREDGMDQVFPNTTYMALGALCQRSVASVASDGFEKKIREKNRFFSEVCSLQFPNERVSQWSD